MLHTTNEDHLEKALHILIALYIEVTYCNNKERYEQLKNISFFTIIFMARLSNRTFYVTIQKHLMKTYRFNYKP